MSSAIFRMCILISRMALLTSSFSLGLTGLFDKAETGAGVIFIILLFGAFPGMFINVCLSISF